MNIHELRSVLRERGDGPQMSNPERYAQIQVRIRRVRLRRRVAAAGAVLTAVSVIALSLVDLTQSLGRSHDTIIAVQPSSDLPEQFTADDGAQYKRLATAKLTLPGQQKTSVTVPVSGRSLDVAAICDGGMRAGISPVISINGQLSVESSFINLCTNKMTLKPLSVPEGASEVTITFAATSYRESPACEKGDGTKTCEPVAEQLNRYIWDFAVYEWVPAESPNQPPAPKAFPDRVEGERLLEVKNGMWPQSSEATFKVMGRGRKMGLDQLCTGTLADRLRFTIRVNGRDLGNHGNCGVWTSGPYPMAISEFDAPAGKWVTVKLRWETPGASPDRPVRWSVGLFERLK